MNTYIKILLALSVLFFSCAVQAPPTGGAPDNRGPYVKKILPVNGTFDLDKKQSIEISFNEMIDPKTVKSSITVFPEIDLVINSYNNKIIIKPENEWPDNQIFKIKLSRYISDFHGNILNNGKTLTFNTSTKMPTGEIKGQLFNHDKIHVSQIALYKITDNNFEFVCTTENNHLNEYQFNNINNGEYFVVALNGRILDVKEDIKIFNYGISTDKIIINDNSINNDINFSVPADRKYIKSANMINQNYGIVQMSDGENIHIVNENFSNNLVDEKIIYYDFSTDSINFDIKLTNNIEYYNLYKTVYLKTYSDDIINPFIENVDYDRGNVIINFSEPINIIEKNSVFTTLNNDLEEKILAYKFISPMMFEIVLDDKNINSITIDNLAIVDISKNKNVLVDTLISVSYSENFADKKVGGNVFGKVIYEGKNKIIVEAINLKNGKRFKTELDKYGDFKFYNLDVSIYQFWAYENINNINNSYFNGTIDPLKYAAKFGYYDDIIETRAKWDIEDIRIRIN